MGPQIGSDGTLSCPVFSCPGGLQLRQDAVNIILQLIFQLPYMRSFDLRRQALQRAKVH